MGQEYNSIFIIINKFTKQGYFIAYIKKILIKKIAQIYIKEIFTKYRILDKIILNRDIKFILSYQQIFTAEQGIKIVVLTIYYLQTDSQIERLNQILKQYLRHYINHTQNNQVLHQDFFFWGQLLRFTTVYGEPYDRGGCIQSLAIRTNRAFRSKFAAFASKLRQTAYFAINLQ